MSQSWASTWDTKDLKIESRTQYEVGMVTKAKTKKKEEVHEK